MGSQLGRFLAVARQSAKDDRVLPEAMRSAYQKSVLELFKLPQDGTIFGKWYHNFAVFVVQRWMWLKKEIPKVRS